MSVRCGHGLLAGVERAAVLRVATAGTPPYAEGTSPNADARHSFSLELLTASRVRRTGDIPSHETTAVTDAVDSRIVREIPFGWMSLGGASPAGHPRGSRWLWVDGIRYWRPRPPPRAVLASSAHPSATSPRPPLPELLRWTRSLAASLSRSKFLTIVL